MIINLERESIPIKNGDDSMDSLLEIFTKHQCDQMLKLC